MAINQTLTLSDDHSGDGEASTIAPFLFQVVSASDAARPSAHRLDGVRWVDLGRGDSTRVLREGDRLALAVADPWLSSKHCQLQKQRMRWTLVDQGSRNGCFVNGEKKSQTVLSDGDVICLGRTLFIFRERLDCMLSDPADIQSSELSQLPAFRSLRPELLHQIELLRRVAESRLSVLLLGPTGSGKELTARAIHASSGRGGPLVAVNCSAIAPNLVESELFGYVKGAFSGATQSKRGFVSAAAGGTLFLDEIGDLPLEAQAKLLRVLQEKAYTPVGSTESKSVDLRVVAATHQDLHRAVEQGRFRQDLLARLRGHEFHLPTLAERREDLGLLLTAVLDEVASEREKRPSLTIEALQALLTYDWPGNGRELHQCMHRACVLVDGGRIGVAELPDEVRTPRPVSASTDEAGILTSAERKRVDDLRQALAEAGGNISAAARTLGKQRSQIQRWIKRYGIDLAEFTSSDNP